ncbi:MAG: glycosyltransferase family 2 protein [Acutalibacteraceae bacterium]
MTVSVVMATYNGLPYLEEQLASVLPQLQEGDELLISDDGSSDGTRERLCALENEDGRVRVLDGPGCGVMENFGYALSKCRGDWIFLCDQDDIWHADKRRAVLAAAEESDALLVMHDARIVDGSGTVISPSFFQTRGSAPGLLKNLRKNSYIGCCMAFSRRLLPYILPFPDGIPMHDQWIGLQAQRHGKVTLLPTPLLDYRRHGGNATGDSHRSVSRMLRDRAGMAAALLKRR